MIKIKLPTGVFEYDPDLPLGERGGFGEVFLGKAPTGEEVAIKKLHLDAATYAHRELEIAAELQGRPLVHVIPFIDAGEESDTGEYFIVMPKADGNLQALIDKGCQCTTNETASIMLQIIRGLVEVQDIVHRDIKPANILLHQGKWKVADFGIARFMEKITSANTLKECRSEDYAAPEQWRSERSTNATDIYAAGCIGYCLLTGHPPFTANPPHEHQFAPVPDLNCSDSRLEGLIKNMLRKPPQSRPTLSRVEVFLSEIVKTPPSADPSDSFSMLASAGAQIADHAHREEVKQEAARKEVIARNEMAKVAFEILAESLERFWGKIHGCTIDAQRSPARGTGVILLGDAAINIFVEGSRDALQKSDVRYSGWDVIATSMAIVAQHNPDCEWSASLWYAKRKAQDEYRWHEIGFFGSSMGFGPYGLSDVNQADNAMAGLTGADKIAYGPWLIDDEKENDFHDRWAWLLTKAAEHKLRRPSILPIEEWPPQL